MHWRAARAVAQSPAMTKPAAVCFSLACGHATEAPAATCPRCGKPMRSARQVAVLGAISLVIGLLLAVGMAVIAWRLAPGMLNPGVPDADGSRFTGTAAQGRQALVLFACVAAVGVFSALGGGWQLATGRRSRELLVLMLLAMVVLALNVWWTLQLFPS